MNTFKSSSRDNSPNSRLNIKKIPFTNDSFKKNPNQITTKIPSKVVKYDKININQKNILGNPNSLSKALNSSNLSNNQKSPDRYKSNSRDFSASFKSTQPSNNNKSFKKDNSSAVSKSISKENIRDKSSEKPDLKSSYDRNITLKKENIKSFNYNNTNSLLKKYENFQNKKSIQINKPSDKKDNSYTNHTRNHSKDSFKNISPKSNDSKNKIKPLSKPRTPDRSSDLSSTDKRKNNFVSPSSLQSKIDFRQMNTSPLLANKKFKKNSNSISVPSNTQLPNKVVVKTKIGEPQKLEIKEVKEITQINNKIKETGVKKYINKIYEISRIGYQGPGVKKQNQDNYFIYENFLNDSDSIFLGVCDGHGIYGHDVSKFLRETIPKEVNNKLLNLNNQNLKNDVIKNTFIDVNNSLISKYKNDVKFSGSTCVSLIYNLNSLLCANVGDSRCVLGKSFDNKEWTYQDLSRDQKPSQTDEMARILENNGRVEPYFDENGEPLGPLRVWLKYEDIPGLAMSRSFGDELASTVGVIAVPEILEVNFKEEDKFIILATDGLWEFIESDECVKIVKDYYLKNDIQGAAEFLVKESSKRWIKEESVIDDITIIIVFLE